MKMTEPSPGGACQRGGARLWGPLVTRDAGPRRLAGMVVETTTRKAQQRANLFECSLFQRKKNAQNAQSPTPLCATHGLSSGAWPMRPWKAFGFEPSTLDRSTSMSTHSAISPLGFWSPVARHRSLPSWPRVPPRDTGALTSDLQSLQPPVTGRGPLVARRPIHGSPCSPQPPDFRLLNFQLLTVNSWQYGAYFFG